MHAQPEDLIDFTVKLKSYSLYNSSCQQSESDINGNAQFQWLVYKSGRSIKHKSGRSIKTRT